MNTNTSNTSPFNLPALKQQTFLVMFICYLPQFLYAPWWISVIFLAVLIYRLFTDYFSYAPMPKWILFFITIGCLSLLRGKILTHEIFIDFFLIVVTLKCLEIHTVRELKFLIIANFYLIFAALIVVQEVWIIFYLFIAIFANLSLMLKFNAPQVSLLNIGSRSGLQLLIAIPLSILLFFIFPRIDPLWRVPFLAQARTGFDDSMSPGSIANLFNDDSIAIQITFKNNPIFNGYWQGVILSYYTGNKWISWYKDANFSSLPTLSENENPDYDIMLEPHRQKWLFYYGYPIASRPNLLFSPSHGLMRQNNAVVDRRLGYSLKIQNPPYHLLNETEDCVAKQLPADINPRLTAWAKMQFANTQQNLPAFIQFLRDYIHQQPFWYTLSPPDFPTDRNKMDTFWFDTKKGYCEYYASAVTTILRAAGVPAHVVIGYYGGQWNPLSRSLTLRQSDAHAWLEYWQEGVGWQRLDPTSFIAVERIDQTIRNHQLDLLSQQDYLTISGLSWHLQFNLFIDSARFFVERWFLFYNLNTQQSLLQHLGVGQKNSGQLLQASVVSVIIFFIFFGLVYQWRQKRTLDKLLKEYHLLQQEFRKFDVPTHPPATLILQCNSLITKAPSLTPIISSFIDHYEQLRLKQSQNNARKQTIALFKSLRYSLRQHKTG